MLSLAFERNDAQAILRGPQVIGCFLPRGERLLGLLLKNS
jgi:hypothetical protein